MFLANLMGLIRLSLKWNFTGTHDKMLVSLQLCDLTCSLETRLYPPDHQIFRPVLSVQTGIANLVLPSISDT